MSDVVTNTSGQDGEVTLPSVKWRSATPFRPTILMRSGLIDETKALLCAYARLGSLKAACRYLVEEGLPQRAHVSRKTIVDVLKPRLVRWNPPSWVLNDLLEAARQEDDNLFQVLLLLHVARQDPVTYQFVQTFIYPAWRNGELTVNRAVVNRFLDQAADEHPEVQKWSYATRDRLASNILTLLRDYGLLRAVPGGQSDRCIREPVVPPPAVRHLARLLEAEGIAWENIPCHKDWHLWLWDEARVRQVLAAEGLKEGAL